MQKSPRRSKSTTSDLQLGTPPLHRPAESGASWCRCSEPRTGDTKLQAQIYTQQVIMSPDTHAGCGDTYWPHSPGLRLSGSRCQDMMLSPPIYVDNILNSQNRIHSKIVYFFHKEVRDGKVLIDSCMLVRPVHPHPDYSYFCEAKGRVLPRSILVICT